MPGRATPLLVVLALLVSGCAGTLGPEVGAGPTPNRTPQVPGLSEAGIEDAGALVDRHEAELEGRSYTLRTTVTLVRTDTGERSRIVRELRADPESGRQSFVQRAEGRFPDALGPQDGIVGYSDGNETVAVFEDGPRTIRSRYPYVLNWNLFDGDDVVYFVDDLPASSVERTEYDGWIAYRVEATEPANASALERTSAAMTVDSFGLVRHFRLETTPWRWSHLERDYWLPWDRLEVTVEYRDLGTTAVDRPAGLPGPDAGAGANVTA